MAVGTALPDRRELCPSAAGGIEGISGTINPAGEDPGLERVLLLNTLAATIDLNGWALLDKNKRRHPLDGIVMEPGAVTALTLPGTTIQLSNDGGIITLLNSQGLKVHGVQYTKKDVSQQGRTIVFQAGS